MFANIRKLCLLMYKLINAFIELSWPGCCIVQDRQPHGVVLYKIGSHMVLYCTRSAATWCCIVQDRQPHGVVMYKIGSYMVL